MIPICPPFDARTHRMAMTYTDVIGDDGMVTRTHDVEPIPMDDVRARAIGAVGEIVARIRCALLTDLPGQETTYAAKEREAMALATDPDDPAPYLRAEAVALGVGLAELAASVRAASTAWHAVNVAIEARRRALMVAIEAAPTPEAVVVIEAEMGGGWPDVA